MDLSDKDTNKTLEAVLELERLVQQSIVPLFIEKIIPYYNTS